VLLVLMVQLVLPDQLVLTARTEPTVLMVRMDLTD
jgi:hypothetical protein